MENLHSSCPCPPCSPDKDQEPASQGQPSWHFHHAKITKKNNRAGGGPGRAAQTRLPKKEQRRARGPERQRWALPPAVIFSLLFLPAGAHCSCHCEEFQADMTKGTKQPRTGDIPCGPGTVWKQGVSKQERPLTIEHSGSQRALGTSRNNGVMSRARIPRGGWQPSK